jgi:hypothetical protein
MKTITEKCECGCGKYATIYVCDCGSHMHPVIGMGEGHIGYICHYCNIEIDTKGNRV